MLLRSIIAAVFVSVLSISSFAAKPSAPPVQTAPVTKVNVNTAKAKDLLNVKGINPATARAIVTYRKKHGNFKTMEDLTKVRKLSKLAPEELKSIQEQLSI